MIRLQVLGHVGLSAADGREFRSVLQQPKRLALLTYLALSSRSGYIRRDALMALFWPELETARARNALRQALHFLRTELGNDVLIARGETDLRIDSERLWCDAVAFQNAEAEGRLEEALGFYQQDLLATFYVPNAREFEFWLELERDRLKRVAVKAAWRLVDQLEGSSGGEVLQWAERATALSGANDAAVQRLIRLYLQRGDRAGALRAFESFRHRLAAEYELEPAPETGALIQHLLPENGGSQRRARRNERAREPEPVSKAAVKPSRRWRRRWPAVAALLPIAGAVLLLQSGGDTRPRLDPELIAVGPFEVLDARHALWGEGVTGLLSANLDGAGAIRTLSPATALRHWRGGYSRDAAADLGRVTGAGLAVSGHVLSMGSDSVRVHAILVDAGRAEILAEAEVRGPEVRIGELADSLTFGLLRGLGRSRAVGSVRSTTIASRPLPALKAFLRGEQYFRRTAWDSAAVLYAQAIELDSTFAPALRRLGNVRNWQGVAGGAAARAAHLRAGRFNHGLSLRDSLLVLADSLAAALYAFQADPDWWAHRRRLNATLDELSRRYPEDAEVWYLIGEAGLHFNTLAGISVQEILAALDRAIALDSAFTPAYVHAVNLAAALDDRAAAQRYARAYLERARVDVTANGIRLFTQALARPLTARDSVASDRAGSPAAILEAWVPLYAYPDSAESAIRVARWLTLRDWAEPPPLDDPAFTRRLLARSLALRGHLGEALETASDTDFELIAEASWLTRTASPAALRQLERAARATAEKGRAALPWWATRRDTAAIATFIGTRREFADTARGPDRERALYDVASALAYEAAARGDHATALGRVLSLPDSLCPECYLPRLLRAELLLRSGRVEQARQLLSEEMTAIVGGPRPSDVLWRLLRAEAEERAGNTGTAMANYRYVLRAWLRADPGLQPLVARARAGLDRVTRSGRPPAR